MQCFKDSYIVTKFCQISCTGKSGRTGTDDCNFMTILCLCTLRLNIMLQSVIRNKSLKLSDRNCFTFNTTDTFSLTLGLLWADTSTDSRKGTGLTDHLISLFDISCFYLLNKCRDIDGYRTSLDTSCILTVQTSRCLFHCLFFIVSKTYFFKVGSTYLWFLFSYRYFFHHISHYSSPPQCPHPP